MIINIAHKIQLTGLTDEQINYLNKASGTARFTYNWCLIQYQKQLNVYKTTKLKDDRPDALQLRKQLNSIKKEQFSWMYEVGKDCTDRPFHNFQKSLNNFFKNPKHFGFPKFKSRKKSTKSFYISSDRISVDNESMTVKIPVIGQLKLSEQLRFTGKIMSGVVSSQGNKWFISISVDISDNPEQLKEFYNNKRTTNNNLKDELKIKNYNSNKSKEIGADFGIKTAIVTSDGEEILAPKPLKKYLKRLRRQNKSLARKVGGVKFIKKITEKIDDKNKPVVVKEKIITKSSNNREKARQKLAKTHYKISSIRKDWTHKVSKYLCSEYADGIIALEDLHIKGMVKNHKLARAITDVGLGMLGGFIEYRSVFTNTEVRVIDRFAPSSKCCNLCDWRFEEQMLSDRDFICQNKVCKNYLVVVDRDYNASLNILKFSKSDSKYYKNSNKISKLDKVVSKKVDGSTHS